MLDEIYDDLQSSFETALDRLRRELAKVRTGRANPSILDGISVDYYGQPTPLAQAATVKVPEPRLITVTPWDKGLIGAIERAINMSDIGLNPSNDGSVIRLPIPALTQERRQELAKQARKIGEDARVAVRAARRDANELVKSLEKDKAISEDEMHSATDRVQKLTDGANSSVDQIVAEKEKEILEV